MNTATFWAEGWTRKYLECCWITSLHHMAGRVSRRMVMAWHREDKPPSPYAAFPEWCDAHGFQDREGQRLEEAIKAYTAAGGAR